MVGGWAALMENKNRRQRRGGIAGKTPAFTAACLHLYLQLCIGNQKPREAWTHVLYEWNHTARAVDAAVYQETAAVPYSDTRSQPLYDARAVSGNTTRSPPPSSYRYRFLTSLLNADTHPAAPPPPPPLIFTYAAAVVVRYYSPH